MIERPDRDNVQPTPESVARQTAAARAVLDYCLNISDCRRVQLLHYFDEKFKKKTCGRGCDNCAHSEPLVTRNVTAQARAAVELVQLFQTKKDLVTLAQCRDILRGANTSTIRAKQHDQLPLYGIAKDKDMPQELLEQVFRRLCLDDVLKETPIIQKSGFHTDYIVVSGCSIRPEDSLIILKPLAWPRSRKISAFQKNRGN
jgi:superfamily II DNA helicase RecQ